MQNNQWYVYQNVRSTQKPGKDSEIVESIVYNIQHYKDHPSIKAITEILIAAKMNSFTRAEKEEINKILRSSNPKKSTGHGPYCITAKILKYSANILDSYLTDIINCDLANLCSPKMQKLLK